ncbi:MAG: spore maturation protein [Clostridiales bacterium]|nr:spore maturation protein [Clostridiales bacterium]
MTVSSYVLPTLVFALIVYALVKKVNIYNAFIESAGKALPELLRLIPCLAAMLTALEALKSSGALGAFMGLVSPLAEKLGLAPPLVPLILLRPFSGSSSLALLRDVLTEHGADSPIGRAASVLVGSTETVFYTVTVYFGAVGVTKTRHAVPAALISGAVGAAVGVLLTRVM